jgi:hypothetical protein
MSAYAERRFKTPVPRVKSHENKYTLCTSIKLKNPHKVPQSTSAEQKNRKINITRAPQII